VRIGRSRPGLVALAVALLAPSAPAPAGPVVTTDLLRMRSAASIDVAADGSRAVVVVASIGGALDADDPAAALRGESHLYVADLSARGDGLRRLTFGGRLDRQAVISPDGRRVAFVRDGENGPPAQVWVMPLDGGEARPVTDLEHGAEAPRWSPDGARLLVASWIPAAEIDAAPPWPSERPGRRWNDTPDVPPGVTPHPDGSRADIRAWLDANAAGGDPAVITRLDFQEETRLRDPMRCRHLFLADPDGDTPPAPVTSGLRSFDDAAFMPDGRRVVCVAAAPADAHPDRTIDTAVWQVDLDGGQGGSARPVVALEGWRLEDPRPAWDGTVIAVRGMRTDEPSFRPWQLGLAGIGGADEPVAWLTDPDTFDASVGEFRWARTHTALIFRTARRGGYPLLTIGPGLLEPTTLVDGAGDGPVGVQQFGVGGGAIVYTLTTPARPCVLRVQDARGDRVLADLNPWVAGRTLSMPVGGVVRHDGREIEYWAMPPAGEPDGGKHPTVLAIHGGPASMWGPGELSMWHEFQLLCSWGYGVVYANPRGSSGYGYAFRRANYQDWGAGPAGDVLAALDDAARRHEWIDPDRLVVTGGSYGGYLTAWIVGHDQRFKAAVAQRGVYHLPTFFGEANAWRLVERPHPHAAAHRARQRRPPRGRQPVGDDVPGPQGAGAARGVRPLPRRRTRAVPQRQPPSPPRPAEPDHRVLRAARGQPAAGAGAVAAGRARGRARRRGGPGPLGPAGARGTIATGAG
jgi:dipeptidyl aminopeptidase/acylaminoacyl peptidase